MQPSFLALKQIQAMLNEMISRPALAEQQNRCQQPLEQDFPREW